MQATKLLKSKSSNSAITKTGASDNRRQGHKSLSSAGFPPNGGFKKKKSMYVEKRSTKVSLRCQIDTHKKVPSPPRRARNTFISNILTILDQSTQGTQTGAVMGRSTVKRKRNAKVYDLPDNVGTEIVKSQHSLKSKKRISNTQAAIKEETVISDALKGRLCSNDFIMRPNKEMSANSDDTVTCLKKSSIYDEVPDGFLSQIADEDATKPLIKDKHSKNVVRPSSDPLTLVSELTNKENFDHLKQNISGKLPEKEKKEAGLYNFFMDVLETTYSYYNIAPMPIPNYSNVLGDADDHDSKTKFRINVDVEEKERVDTPERTVSNKTVRENVALESEINRERDMYRERNINRDIEIRDKYEDEGYYVQDDEIEWQKDDTYHSNFFPDKRQRPRTTNAGYSFGKRKLKSAPPGRERHQRKQIVNEQSFHEPGKSSKKMSKKEQLLNILKEELAKPANVIHEPENMFQALKVIAKNKKKQERKICFADMPPRASNTDQEDYVCQFKGRNVIKPKLPFCSMPKTNKRGVQSKYAARPIPGLPALDQSDSDYDYGDDYDYMDQHVSDTSLKVHDYVTDYQVPGQRMPNKNILYATDYTGLDTGVNDYDKRINDNFDSVVKNLFEMRVTKTKKHEKVKSVNRAQSSKMSTSESELESDIEGLSMTTTVVTVTDA